MKEQSSKRTTQQAKRATQTTNSQQTKKAENEITNKVEPAKAMKGLITVRLMEMEVMGEMEITGIELVKELVEASLGELIFFRAS